MTRLIISSFVAAFFAVVMLLPVPASAGSFGITSSTAREASLVKEAGWRNRRWWRSNGYDTEVDAPTTSVRTNNRKTDVESAVYLRAFRPPRYVDSRAVREYLGAPRLTLRARFDLCGKRGRMPALFFRGRQGRVGPAPHRRSPRVSA